MLRISQLKAFLAVIETGSFSQGAERLSLSKAAITQHIQHLESQLGVQLIKRTTRRLALTELGEIFLDKAKQVLESLDEIEREIGQQTRLPKGALRVMSNPYFAKRFVIPQLEDFTSHFPDIHLTLLLEERFPDLEKEQIDLLVGVSMDGPQDMIRKQVASTRYLLCASPNYLARCGEPKRPHDLISHQYITHAMRRPDHLISFKKNETVMVQPSLRLNDADAMVQCASQGLGIIKVHDYMVKDKIETGELIEILKSFNEGSIPIYAYFKSHKYMTEKVRVFLKFVENHL
ncbi:MAG: LysR substrate-binding domain-containing protein [Gammaproteobacteria bacterium]